MDVSHIEAALIAWAVIATFAIGLIGKVVITAIEQWRLVQKALDNHAEHINVIESTAVPHVQQILGTAETVGNGHASSSNPGTSGSDSGSVPSS